MEQRVKDAIEKVRPLLQRDGGDVEFAALEGKTVKVRLKGACCGCPMSQMTIKSVVEETIKREVPEIEKVENVM
ncbi:MAG: NifU family protein [Candidatus Omnitrophota bacterium]|nr:NifU family protein [Candidatus Omnitrophota bacterium]